MTHIDVLAANRIANTFRLNAYNIHSVAYERQINGLSDSISRELSLSQLGGLERMQQRKQIALAIVHEIQTLNLSQNSRDNNICNKILGNIDEFVLQLEPLEVNQDIFDSVEKRRFFDLLQQVETHHEMLTDFNEKCGITQVSDEYIKYCLSKLNRLRQIFWIKNLVSYAYFVIQGEPIIFVLLLIGALISTTSVLFYIYFRRRYVYYGCQVTYTMVYGVHSLCDPLQWNPSLINVDSEQIGSILAAVIGIAIAIVPVLYTLVSGRAQLYYIRSLRMTCQLNALKLYVIQKGLVQKQQSFDFYTSEGNAVDVTAPEITEFICHQTNKALLFYGLTYEQIFQTQGAFSPLVNKDTIKSKGFLLFFQEFSEVNAGVLLFFVRSATWLYYILFNRNEFWSGYTRYDTRLKVKYDKAALILQKNSRRKIKTIQRDVDSFFIVKQIRIFFHNYIVYPLFALRLMYKYFQSYKIVLWTIFEFGVSVIFLFGQPALSAYVIFPLEENNLNWFTFPDRSTGYNITVSNSTIHIPNSFQIASTTAYANNHPFLILALVYLLAFLYHVSGIISIIVGAVLTILFHNSVSRIVWLLLTNIVSDFILGLVLYGFNMNLEKRLYIHAFCKIAPFLPIQPRLSTTLIVANLSDKFNLSVIPRLFKTFIISKIDRRTQKIHDTTLLIRSGEGTSAST